MNNNIGILQYPQDLPKFYMGFQIEKYSRESLMAIGHSTPLNHIALPFPERMFDANQVAYDQFGFSATVGGAINAGFGPVQDLANRVADGNIGVVDALREGSKIGGAVDKAGAGALPGLAVDAATALAGEAAKAALGAAGYAPNYFLTVVLTGPRYKQHTFTWTFAPRSPQEAVDLTQIIRVFKDAEAPGLTAGGALFSFPRIFRNYYAPDPAHLYQFKPCVLVNFTVDYTGGGAVSMRQARAETNQWNTPTALKVSATFLELEFWLRSDFGDVMPGASGNQPVANQRNPSPGTARDAK